MTSVKGKGWRSDETMEDDSDEKDIKRKCRNLSEKKRRDQFNLLVKELNSMVTSGGRKLDKSTILKQTICFLKNHSKIKEQSQLHEIKEDWKPSFLTNDEFIHLVLEAIDAFMIAFSISGEIYYISENITSLLGYTTESVLKMTIFDMAYEEERNNIYRALINNADKKSQISFSCYLRRGCANLKRKDFFERVNLVGYLRSDETLSQTNGNFSIYSREERLNNKLLFVGTGRLQTSQLIREISIIDSINNEFSSRYSLEWKFLFLDHRAPPIIGYLPFELLGTSGYDYYHIDDLEEVIRCHEALIYKGEGTSCYYRFLTKGQQWIWLQSRFYITYHQWNAKPEFVVCIHRVINYSEVVKKSKLKSSSEQVTDPSLQYNNDNMLQWEATKPASTTKEIVPEIQTLPADSISNTQNTQTVQCKLISLPSQPTPLAQQQFIEPTQYVTTIPLQPVISNFSSPVVLSPISSAELTQEQNIIHADLQRKHAELQASIGQQQAELRAVSEQLLMAKLGLMSSQAHTTNANIASYSYTCPGTVSSTTNFGASTITAVVPAVTIVQSIPQNELLTPLVPVSSNMETSQVDHLYLLPDSNTSSTLEELK